MFVDSTSAISRVGDDAPGPSQRFAVAAIEVCSRILARDNDVTIRWAPAHSGARGNKVANEYTKNTVTDDAPVEEIPEGFSDETSLSHMTRVAAEARSRETAEWISEHVRAERLYNHPPGTRPPPPPAPQGEEDPRRPLLPALIWPCGDRDLPPAGQEGGHERVLVCQRRAPVAAPPLYTVPGVGPAGQEDVEEIGKACEWKHPHTPSEKLLWDGLARRRF